MSRFSFVASTVFGIVVCSFLEVSSLPVLVLATVLLSASVFAATRSRAPLAAGILLAASGAVLDILCSPTLAAAHLGATTVLPALVDRSRGALGVLSVLALVFLLGYAGPTEPRTRRLARWVAPDALARTRWFASAVW